MEGVDGAPPNHDRDRRGKKKCGHQRRAAPDGEMEFDWRSKGHPCRGRRKKPNGRELIVAARSLNAHHAALISPADRRWRADKARQGLLGWALRPLELDHA